MNAATLTCNVTLSDGLTQTFGASKWEARGIHFSCKKEKRAQMLQPLLLQLCREDKVGKVVCLLVLESQPARQTLVPELL